MPDLAQIRFVTGAFYYLQGLRMVPIGLWLILFAAGLLGRQGDWTLSFPAFLLAVIAYKVLGTYYDRTYGRVERTLAARRNELILLAVLLIGMFVGSWLDAFLAAPVSFLGLSLAIFLFAIHVQSPGGYRLPYAAFAGLMALVSFLPLVAPLEPDAHWRLILGLLGAAYALGGLWDHRLLVMTLKPIPQQDNG